VGTEPRWTGRRGLVSAVVIGFAVLVGFQFAGYGLPFKLVDFLCCVALGVASAFLQYDFVDGIARLDAMTTRHRERRPLDARQEVKERIRVSIVGLLAFLFLTFTALMFVRLFV
jgi:hypothetical protein